MPPFVSILQVRDSRCLIREFIRGILLCFLAIFGDGSIRHSTFSAALSERCRSCCFAFSRRAAWICAYEYRANPYQMSWFGLCVSIQGFIMFAGTYDERYQ